MKRTFQPKKKKRLRKLGFLARKSTPGGKNVLKRRRKKGRHSLSVSDEFKLKRKSPKDKMKRGGKKNSNKTPKQSKK